MAPLYVAALHPAAADHDPNPSPAGESSFCNDSLANESFSKHLVRQRMVFLNNSFADELFSDDDSLASESSF